jgi:hypothetical protein
VTCIFLLSFVLELLASVLLSTAMFEPPSGDCNKFPNAGIPAIGFVAMENSDAPGDHTVEVAQLVIV